MPIRFPLFKHKIMIMILILLILNIASSYANYDNIAISVELHKGCNNGNRHCNQITYNNKWCFTAEECYYESLRTMSKNGNNTDYWIKWSIHTQSDRQKRTNFNSNSIHNDQNSNNIILDDVIGLGLFSGCTRSHSKCDYIVGNDVFTYCSNATDCYYSALNIWTNHGQNKRNWIKVVFFTV